MIWKKWLNMLNEKELEEFHREFNNEAPYWYFNSYIRNDFNNMNDFICWCYFDFKYTYKWEDYWQNIIYKYTEFNRLDYVKIINISEGFLKKYIWTKALVLSSDESKVNIRLINGFICRVYWKNIKLCNNKNNFKFIS